MTDFSAHRPPGYTGRGDRFLPQIMRELTSMLVSQQDDLVYETLCLPDSEWSRLAVALVEFAEDIHHEIGLWRSLERYQQTFFGTPLPLILPAHQPVEPTSLAENRIRHLLWVLYAEINPDLILGPGHQDLQYLAHWIAGFLAERFATVPPGSGVKQFLTQPNRFGWDVKRKLVWLGQHAYLFRYHFQNYVNEHGGQADIKTIDDFVCQQPTSWAGLGVIDILAETLAISAERRADLRSWYERHAAYYRVRALKRSGLQVVNLINDQPYTVRQEKAGDFFKVGQVVFGSLVPWAGDWYWSGEQLSYADMLDSAIQAVKQEFLEKRSRIAYRYCPALVEQAREMVQGHYDRFVAHHGGDLAVYPDGLTMAADMQKEDRLHNETLPPAEREAVMKAHGLTSPAPKMPFPQALIESANGVGVYFNREEGREIMVEFNDVMSGLQKDGAELTEAEEAMLQNIIYSPVISPAFIQRLVQASSDASLAAAFLIRNRQDQTYLAYLLRRHKGHFYRKRYPNLAIV